MIFFLFSERAAAGEQPDVSRRRQSPQHNPGQPISETERGNNININV